MPTIVEQLQGEAVDPAISVSALLRKVKLAAVKLSLEVVEDWVELELNGYTTEVPEYRRKVGRPKVLNPYRGWIPMQGPHRFMSAVSSVEIRQSIASLEALLSDATQSTFFLPFSPRQVEEINKGSEFDWPDMGRELGRSQIAEILDRVRTLVLDWALALEQQGILGSNISFAPEEKQLAHERQVNIHIGSIGNLSGSLNADVHGSNPRINISSRDDSDNVVKD